MTAFWQLEFKAHHNNDVCNTAYLGAASALTPNGGVPPPETPPEESCLWAEAALLNKPGQLCFLWECTEDAVMLWDTADL